MTMVAERKSFVGNDVANGKPPSAYEIYCDYIALKNHFNQKSYDYFKYRGKTSATKASFANRTDGVHFFKMIKQPNWHDRIVANFAEKKDAWIGDIVLDNPGDLIYKDWRRRRDSLSYTFRLDLRKLPDDYTTVFAVKDGQHPEILTSLLQKDICIETFAILMNFAKVEPYWDAKLNDKFIAPKYIMQAKKYYPFISYDRNNFKEMVKDHFL
jgi:hypothetical protein